MSKVHNFWADSIHCSATSLATVRVRSALAFCTRRKIDWRAVLGVQRSVISILSRQITSKRERPKLKTLLQKSTMSSFYAFLCFLCEETWKLYSDFSTQQIDKLKRFILQPWTVQDFELFEERFFYFLVSQARYLLRCCAAPPSEIRRTCHITCQKSEQGGLVSSWDRRT